MARLEAKEFLSEAEERRYRAIKYDLAYKRRLLDDDDDDDEEAARRQPQTHQHQSQSQPQPQAQSHPSRLAGGTRQSALPDRPITRGTFGRHG